MQGSEKEYKCSWREGKDCLAHLAEGRLFECPPFRGEPMVCMDYKKELIVSKPQETI